MITIRDIMENNTQLYNVIVATYYEGDYDKTNLFKGEVANIPENLLDKDIIHIYAEHDYDTTCNYVVFEVEN